ncbi:MAG TPA: YgiQ family radical SAM protein [Polyangia bacterium]|nr:YgiQ family radical SAM protein [Polyangia bacterium]
MRPVGDGAPRSPWTLVSPDRVPRTLFSRRKHWAERFGVAPVLPTTREEMDALGWDSCDVVLVTGDAYVDHPSFGMALVGRLLEAQGFRVGILAQPDWRSAEPFAALGRPNVMWGVTAGNMDSMVNRYTSDRRLRHDDAYSPDAAEGLRPDRAVLVYAQRCREAFSDVPLVLGGIEASLRRIAHYDYWSDKVRRSILVDAKADLLVFGNGERAVVEIAHRLAAGESPGSITNVRGTAFLRATGAPPEGWGELDSRAVDTPGPVEPPRDPYAMEEEVAGAACAPAAAPTLIPTRALKRPTVDRAHTVVRLPDFDAVAADPVLYAHASRLLHVEANPGNARALVQRHGDRDVWLNPPALPLSTEEYDKLYELPYTRTPHPRYGGARIPAYEMIRFSITIMRGCFGGCSFCSITEHEGRVIQSRSETSVLREIERVRDDVPGFSGVISDLGGPTANMYRLACKSPEVEAACRLPSCVHPDVCPNLRTDHAPLIQLYRKARAIPGIKKILVASGLRYDLAVKSPEYIRELATHHVGGYLKIAPEHTEDGPLSKMLKPGIATYETFKRLFDEASAKAGKKQYLIPYFIASHPGTTDEDMLALALWLKKNGFKADQVQTFLPSPMATATAMYHSGKNPLRKVRRDSEDVPVPKGLKVRRLHKAFLRYHDPANWPALRDALRRLGREDLIGSAPHQLVPLRQPAASSVTALDAAPRGGPGTFRTQHARPAFNPSGKTSGKRARPGKKR